MSRISEHFAPGAYAEQMDLALPAPDSPPADVPPEVLALFETLALQVAAKGFTRYSADAVLHQVRWTYHVDRGNREFKCNDHWTAPLARWFLARHPELPGFFETRIRRAA